MEPERNRGCSAASAVIPASFQTVVVKWELSRKAREPAEVVEASDLDASWAPWLGGLPVTSNWEETWVGPRICWRYYMSHPAWRSCKALLGRAMSGISLLPPRPDPRQEEENGWTDKIVLFSLLCSLCKRKRARKRKQGNESVWKKVDVRQLPAQSHIKRMLTSPLGGLHPFSI